MWGRVWLSLEGEGGKWDGILGKEEGVGGVGQGVDLDKGKGLGCGVWGNGCSN